MSILIRTFGAQRPLAFSLCNRAQHIPRRSFLSFFRSDQQGVSAYAGNKSCEEGNLTKVPRIRKRTRRSQNSVPTLGRQSGGILAAAGVVKESSVGPVLTKLLSVCPPVTAILVFFSPYPAIKRIIEDGTTGELPLLPYSSMLGCGIVWSAYGILAGDATIYSPNLIGILCGAYYMRHFIANCPSDYNYKLHTKGIQALTLWTLGCATFLSHDTALFTMGLTGDAVVIALFGGPLVVIKSILKEKSTRNLPFEFTMVAFMNTALWTGYGTMVIHDPFVWIPNGIGLVFTSIQMSFFYRFGIQNAPFLGIKPPQKQIEKEM